MYVGDKTARPAQVRPDIGEVACALQVQVPPEGLVGVAHPFAERAQRGRSSDRAFVFEAVEPTEARAARQPQAARSAPAARRSTARR